MEIRVYNADLYRIGQVENQISLIWTRKFFEPGNFEIHAPITQKNLELFAAGNLVSLKGAKEAGVIEDIEKEESDLKNEITVKGRFLSSYMDRRVIHGTVTYENAKIEVVMRTLLMECAAIPHVELGELNGYDDRVSFQVTYRGLQDVLTKIAKFGLIGYRFTPDFDNHKIIFDTMKGVDRSFAQSTNNRVIFSEDYNNLTNAIYKYNDQKVKTVAIVGGQGEGSDRVYVTVGTGTGLSLREVFVDARDLTQEEGMTLAQYKELLKQRGYEALQNAIIAESLECEAEPSINFQYKEDYDLGDIVTVKKKSWGLYMNKRITEIQEVYEYGGGYVVPTLGDPLPEKIDWGNNT